jgi:hypothetical protein
MASRGNILRGHDSEPDAEYVKSISAPEASLTTGSMSRASVGDVMEDAERSIRLQQELHASRKGDAKVHGEPMEVETRSIPRGIWKVRPAVAGPCRPLTLSDSSSSNSRRLNSSAFSTRAPRRKPQSACASRSRSIRAMRAAFLG